MTLILAKQFGLGLAAAAGVVALAAGEVVHAAGRVCGMAAGRFVLSEPVVRVQPVAERGGENQRRLVPSFRLCQAKQMSSLLLEGGFPSNVDFGLTT